MHGGPSPGAPEGNQNAFKHGRYAVVLKSRNEILSELEEIDTADE
jgi:uncharacterized protein YjcR